ncbi:DUF397 domain-containing protein [Streptomyces sp. NPDC020802]|uniref:DUF397 domain-containing protein n=1 Tax=Streptomyces sp. NPDC020802 TaxID=3365094 RepID=UPI003788C23C
MVYATAINGAPPGSPGRLGSRNPCRPGDPLRFSTAWRVAPVCSEAVPLEWFKSSASGSENCVEVARANDVWVRDSKDPDRPLLHFSHASWAVFTGRMAQHPLSDGG